MCMHVYVCIIYVCTYVYSQTATLEGINSGDARPTYNISYSVYDKTRYATERQSFVDNGFVRLDSNILPPLTGVGVRKSTTCRALGYFDDSK